MNRVLATIVGAVSTMTLTGALAYTVGWSYGVYQDMPTLYYSAGSKQCVYGEIRGVKVECSEVVASGSRYNEGWCSEYLVEVYEREGLAGISKLARSGD